MEASPINNENIFLLRKTNVWYTICDGEWNNPNIWISNALDLKNITVPQSGDTVYVNHNVDYSNSNATGTYTFNNTINNLVINGLLTANGAGLNTNKLIVTGNLYCTGTIDFSTATSPIYLYLGGAVNYINAFNCGTFSTIIYNSPFDQTVLPLTYYNLSTSGSCTKYQSGSIVVNGAFSPQSNFECGAYSLSVYGQSTIGIVGSYIFSKNSSIGNILFAGNVDFEGGTNFSGNPNIEFRAGITIHTFNLITGSGIFSFTTNSQTITCSAYLGGTWNASIVVTGAITLTLAGAAALTVNSTINGTLSTSTFNNSGILYLGYNSTPMTTGVFNYNYTSISTLGYTFNGAFTLPYTSYANLVIGGTGMKTLAGNTTINQTLVNNGSLECNGHNLSVLGTFTHTGGGNFTANSFCSILFAGFAEFNSTLGSGYVDLRTGNPNLEFRDGWDVHAQYCYTGTGTFSFTTANQALSFSAYNNGILAANFLIVGAITVSFTSGTVIPLMTGTLNGSSSSSTFANQGTFAYNNAQQPMQTGVLTNSLAASVFVYSLNGNQNLTAGTYQNLTLSVGGVKTLQGNVTVTNSYTLSSPATLNLNGYTLTL